ncbi:MAG: spermidine synthase, partial [Candidatus Bipolaricaulia bacterium]
MPERAPSTAGSPIASVTVVYVLSLILSACSLLYELLIAQTLTLIAGNMVIWYSLTVGTYLAAMGVGAILYGSPTRSRDWGRLYRVEIMLSLIGASAVILLNFAHFLHLFQTTQGAGTLSTYVFFGLSFTVTFLIGVLTGMELPLLIDLGNELAAGTNVTNRVLGWDYIGALAGGVTFPLFLVPFLELHTIGFVIAALNLLVAVYILRRFLSWAPGATLKTLGSATFGVALTIAYLAGSHIEQYFLKKYYFYIESGVSLATLFDPLHDMPFVYRESSPYQKIDIVHDPGRYDILMEAYSTKFTEDRSKPVDRYLFLNGDFQTTSNAEELYHEWFAHVPIIINGKVPERVLVMGAGDGLLHRELLKYDGVKSIVHVDIDHRLVALAKTHPILTALNEHALDDPRVRTVFGDAFQYLRHHPDETYDAIYLDFPAVMDYNLSKLYSREFYHFVKDRLADDGFAALDAPDLYFSSQADGEGRIQSGHGGSWVIHSNTMRLAGFKTILPYY